MAYQAMYYLAGSYRLLLGPLLAELLLASLLLLKEAAHLSHHSLHLSSPFTFLSPRRKVAVPTLVPISTFA